MPSQARTVVTAFNFATITVNDPCKGDIRAGVLDLAYRLDGMPEVRIKTAPDRPVPAPPDEERVPADDNNPVLLLLKRGWKATSFVSGTRQPSGFGVGGRYTAGGNDEPDAPVIVNAAFERLDLSFAFPLYCSCDDGRCVSAANYRLSVRYDGTAHPVIALETSDQGPCADVAARALNKELRSQSGLAGNTATYFFNTFITCDCRNGGGGSDDGGHDDSGGGGHDGGDDGNGGGQDGGGRSGKDKGKRRVKARGKAATQRQTTRRRPPDDEDGAPPPAPPPQRCQVSVIVEYEFRTVL